MKAEKITEDIKPYSPLVVQVRIKTGIGIGIENTHSLFSAVFFSNFSCFRHWDTQIKNQINLQDIFAQVLVIKVSQNTGLYLGF